MPTFVAQVKDNSGKVTKRKIEAMSPEQARTILKQQYAAIGSVKPVGERSILSF